MKLHLLLLGISVLSAACGCALAVAQEYAPNDPPPVRCSVIADREPGAAGLDSSSVGAVQFTGPDEIQLHA